MAIESTCSIYIVVADSDEGDSISSYNIAVFIDKEAEAIAFAKAQAPDHYHITVEHWRGGIEQRDSWATYWSESKRKEVEARYGC